MKKKLVGALGVFTISSLCFTGNVFAGHTHPISEINGLQGALDSKADSATVDAALSAKADQTVVDNAVSSLEVAITNVENAHAAVAAVVATKANQTDLDATNAAVANKAEQAAVNAALATKADVGHGHYYDRMAVVATSGGEYTSPVDAMNDVANWCGTPSATNACLVKIMPGIYDLGSGHVDLKSYVSIAGSGAEVTKITANNTNAAYGTVHGNPGASNVSLTGLTIETTSERAVELGNGTSVYISDCAIVAATTSTIAKGISFMANGNGSLRINDSTIKCTSVDGYAIGIMNYYSNSLIATNVTIDTYSSTYWSQGILGADSLYHNTNSEMVLDNVTFNTNSKSYVASSIMLTAGDGIHNINLSNIKINATSEVSESHGLAINGSYNVSVKNIEAVTSSPYNMIAIGANPKYGVSGTVEVMNSSLTGSVRNNSGFDMKIANTKVDGPITNATDATLKCIGVFDGNFGAVTCP